MTNCYSYEIQTISPETGLWTYYGRVTSPPQHTGFNGNAQKSELAPEEFARQVLEQHVSQYGMEPTARVVVWDFRVGVGPEPIAVLESVELTC